MNTPVALKKIYEKFHHSGRSIARARVPYRDWQIMLFVFVAVSVAFVYFDAKILLGLLTPRKVEQVNSADDFEIPRAETLVNAAKKYDDKKAVFENAKVNSISIPDPSL
ncbi:MAG: hypothetical protein A2928_00220 [Candidatus Taylorbacteria bacterium RIFCSPLOWO2_01_FULL_45_15b]|uniref:Uncharacterized protein n=1 Tax=Candidatus Taylorbacteria bacterium RIFCSPLOWO2_01_FULL_45_15b TaxID=1802319 RepID=A0A1G2N7B3_9BACT|nr:MAG: hypothetical protein A2928_00220 [Candidatus Taylorbacteria bacterium RIFCSPLOWO2_01_FULL_45_15b]